MMHLHIIEQNKKTFLRYNRLRKQFFTELSARDSKAILYLLPWLLSVNNPLCPGYVAKLKRPFRVFNIDNELDIRKREPSFKKMFGVAQKGSFLRPPSKYCLIQAVYTIGSVGSVSQTATSDCDIWICYDKNDYDQTTWVQLNQKVNLIKDWLDANIKMPVFFFISDVNDIKNGDFGTVSSESSGSAQRNVLKDEFYRTCILICGKIPLWWVCYDKEVVLNYEHVADNIKKYGYGFHDVIDLGALERVESNEYFGAALWQLYKALASPFKSIAKLTHLKMLLETPQQNQITSRFRENVLGNKDQKYFPDNTVFMMIAILEYYQDYQKQQLDFLKDCFYMRCEIDPYSKKHILKRFLAQDLLKKYPISAQQLNRLKNFAAWDFESQIAFGNRFFKLLLKIYAEISEIHTGAVSDINRQDLTILGRKLSVCYQKKEYKIPIIKRLTGQMNFSKITLDLDGNMWNVYTDTDKEKPFVRNASIIYIITYIVWNTLFDVNKISMRPNASNITIQEILNIGRKVKMLFGSFDVASVEYHFYLKKETITTLLVVVSSEISPWKNEINDFSVVYLNSWGELFVKRFLTFQTMEIYLKTVLESNKDVVINYYVQRNATSFEKIIERTKKNLQLEQKKVQTVDLVDVHPHAPTALENRLKVIQKYISKMPSLPTTVTKVMEVCNRPMTSPNDLNRVISLDPVLTGHVLKLINSAYYYLNNQVTSLTRAIIMLGLNTVKNLVLSKSIVDIIGKRSSFQALSMDDFWTHSICVGVTARSVAGLKGVPLSGLEEYFVAGLLHDLGKIPLNNRFPKEYAMVLDTVKQNDTFLHDEEYSMFEINHCIVGRMIAEKWKLNETINDSLCYHHQPGEADEPNRSLVEIVALADSYAKMIFSDDFDESFEPTPFFQNQLAKVAIDWSTLSKLRQTILSEIDKAKMFLQPTKQG